MPAPRAPISSIRAQVSSTSDQVGFAAAISRTRGTQWSFSFFMTSTTIDGFEVAPVPPRSTAYASSATAQESFQKSVGVRSHHAGQRAVDRDQGHRVVSSVAATGAAGSQFISQAWSGSSVKYQARFGPAITLR